MIRIINNTDQATERLLVLYGLELTSVKHRDIESIVFDSCRMIVYGVDCIILEVDERTDGDRFEDFRVGA